MVAKCVLCFGSITNMNKYCTILIALTTSVAVNVVSFAITNYNIPSKETEINFEVMDIKPISYNSLKKEDADSIINIINAEGFHQAFNHYSSYRDINDTRFHDLRKAYIAASKDLQNYIDEAAGIIIDQAVDDK